MPLFGKSLEQSAQDALDQIRRQVPGIGSLEARVEGDMVTLTGTAASREAKNQVMALYQSLVSEGNVANMIRVEEPRVAQASMGASASESSAPGAATTEVYEVVKGDTLSAISKRYYGSSGQYMKIFEANRDVLSNPDLIKPGQKLKIPR